MTYPTFLVGVGAALSATTWNTMSSECRISAWTDRQSRSSWDPAQKKYTLRMVNVTLRHSLAANSTGPLYPVLVVAVSWGYVFATTQHWAAFTP